MKDTLSPMQIGSGTNWVKIWAAMLHGAAVQSDGSLWVWGDNPANSTQLSRSTQNFIAPTRISADTNWVDAAFGNQVLLAIKSDGTLWAWGREASNYTGVTGQPIIPTRVGTNSDWQFVSCAEWARDIYVVLWKKDGSLWSLQSLYANATNLQPTQINLRKNWVAVAGGGGGNIGSIGMHDGVCSGVAITRDGEVWAWGRALGEFTPAHPLLQAFAALANKLRANVRWGKPRPIMREQPWPLRNVDTNEISAK
jgi:alpha-tubulin suppressor-like RCC1 family protein